MRTVTFIGGIILAVLLIAACSSSPVITKPLPGPASSVPPPVIESLSGQVTGTQAQRVIQGTAPITFPILTFTGVVATAISNVALGGHQSGDTRIFATPKGDLTVRYTREGSRGDLIPLESLDGNCMFSQVAAEGSYTITGGTGGFANASGHGSYSITFITMTVKSASVKATSCTTANPGKSAPAGTQVVFTASGPLSVPAK